MPSSLRMGSHGGLVHPPALTALQRPDGAPAQACEHAKSRCSGVAVSTPVREKTPTRADCGRTVLALSKPPLKVVRCAARPDTAVAQSTLGQAELSVRQKWWCILALDAGQVVGDSFPVIRYV